MFKRIITTTALLTLGLTAQAQGAAGYPSKPVNITTAFANGTYPL